MEPFNSIGFEEKSNQTDSIAEESAQSESREVLRRQILDDCLYPEIKEQIKKNLNGVIFWDRCSNVFLTLKYLFIIASPIISFSSGVFTDHITILNFVSAASSSIGLGCDRFANYSTSRVQQNAANLNKIFEKFGINYNFEIVDVKNTDSK